ncbi:unnamed protein product [Ascophyllum nodosum]
MVKQRTRLQSPAMHPRPVASSYRAVKDQLVSLSLELEDCSQAVDLLKEALGREQQVAKGLTEQVSTPFRAELEAADAKEKAVLAEHLETVDKVSRFKGQDMLVMLERKRELSTRAKGLLDQIKEARAETTAAVEEIREQGRVEILHAQAIWAQGEDLRREKWMANRTREIRELTLKGLEPEIERIMDKHKAGMEEADCAHHRETQRLRERTFRRAGEVLSEERARLRSRVEQDKRETMETLSERRQALMDKHQTNLERIRKRAAGEAEAQRRWQDEETRRMEGVTAVDVARIRKEEHDRLQEMRLRHAEEMAAASRRKTAALASLARQAEMDREEWDKRAKEEASAVAEEVLDRERERLTTERDKKIDETIRRLQRDRLDFEERFKAEVVAEAYRVEEAHAKDLRALKEKQEQWGKRHEGCTEALHSLVESRRELALRSREVTVELDLVLLKLQKAEATAREGSAVARDEETHFLQGHQELMSESRSRRAELEQRIKSSEDETSGIQIRSKSEISRLREEHDERLERLQREVKEKVANNDENISTLRELVHTESIRAEHASRMLAKYVKRAVAADQAAGSSDGNDGLKTGPRSREGILQDSSRRATSRAR